MYTDKTIICRDCGEEFIFTAGEQEFFAERGLGTEPARCAKCRSRRKRGIAKPRKRVMYEVVCSRCGEVETVPFEPRHDKPVFCNECYRKMREK